jgi:hypothetical protein
MPRHQLLQLSTLREQVETERDHSAGISARKIAEGQNRPGQI